MTSLEDYGEAKGSCLMFIHHPGADLWPLLAAPPKKRTTVLQELVRMVDLTKDDGSSALQEINQCAVSKLNRCVMLVLFCFENRCWTILGSVWDRFGVGFIHRFGIVLGSSLDRFGLAFSFNVVCSKMDPNRPRASWLRMPERAISKRVPWKSRIPRAAH